MVNIQEKSINYAVFAVLSLMILVVIGGGAYVALLQETSPSISLQEEKTYDAEVNQIRLAIEEKRFQDAQTYLAQLPDAALKDPDLLPIINEMDEQVALHFSNEKPGSLASAQTEQAAELGGPDQILRAARTAFSAGQWETAIEHYSLLQSNYTEFEPELVIQNLIVANLNAASELVSANPEDVVKLESALNFYRTVLSLEPENAAALRGSETLNTYLTGLRELRLGNPEQAVEVFTLIYRSNPEYLDGYATQQLYNTFIELGDRAMRVSEREAAIDYFNRAAALDVVDPTAVELRFAGLKRLAPLEPTPTPFVPAPAAVAAPLEPTPTAEDVPELLPPACQDSRTVLTTPMEEEVISGRLRVTGTSAHPDFAYYKLEIAPAGGAEFGYISGKERAVTDGILGTLDTTTLPNGAYVLRLVTVDNTGNYPAPCTVSIKIEN